MVNFRTDWLGESLELSHSGVTNDLTCKITLSLLKIV